MMIGISYLCLNWGESLASTKILTTFVVASIGSSVSNHACYGSSTNKALTACKSNVAVTFGLTFEMVLLCG